MSDKYYWIQPSDRSLNDFPFSRTVVIGNPVYDKKRGVLLIRTREHFPVGGIFHVLKDKEDFVVARKLRRWGNHYEVKRRCGEFDPITLSKIKAGSILFMDGYLY